MQGVLHEGVDNFPARQIWNSVVLIYCLHTEVLGVFKKCVCVWSCAVEQSGTVFPAQLCFIFVF